MIESNMHEGFVITPILKSGADSGIHLNTLCEIFETTPSTIKAQVQAERRAGSLILSDSRGYYLPANRDDLERFYRRQRSHALSRLQTLKLFRQALQQ